MGETDKTKQVVKTRIALKPQENCKSFYYNKDRRHQLFNQKWQIITAMATIRKIKEQNYLRIDGLIDEQIRQTWQ